MCMHMCSLWWRIDKDVANRSIYVYEIFSTYPIQFIQEVYSLFGKKNHHKINITEWQFNGEKRIERFSQDSSPPHYIQRRRCF